MKQNEIDELIKVYDTTEDLIEKAFLSYIIGNKLYLLNDKGNTINYADMSYSIIESIDNLQFIAEYSNTINSLKKSYIGYVLCFKLSQIGNFEESRIYGLPALDLAILEDNLLLIIDILNELGKGYYEQGLYEESKKYYEKSLFYSEKSPIIIDIANAYNNLGAIENHSSNLFKALDYRAKAINLLETNNIFSNHLIGYYTNLSIGYIQIKKYDEAKKYSIKALKLDKQKREPSPYYNLGHIYSELGDQTLGLGYFKKGLKISQEAKNLFWIIECCLEIGSIHNVRGHYDKSLEYYHKALDLLKEFKNNQFLFRASVGLGIVYSKLDNDVEANIHFQNALNLIDSFSAESSKMRFYQQYSEYLRKIGNLDAAYDYLLKHSELKEQLNLDAQKVNMAYIAESFDSEQKTREVEFITQKNEELLVYQKEIISQKEELIKLNEEKDAILLTISHDLKNSIGSIESAIDMIAMKDQDMFEHKYIKIIDKATQQSLSLVKEILYSNKIDQEESQLLQYDINQRILTLYENLNLIAQKKKISFHHDLSEEPLECMIDLEKFDRIIDNLCMNAIKFTNAGGTITIKTQKIGDVAQIHIKDTGIGMDEIMIKNLFEKFSKAGRKGTSGEESTGLGLYIVKTLVEKMDGSVEVYSEVDKGTEFLIKLSLNR
ncbi:MAG: ATP-binding protein [Candidatus Cloacimonetes bacterium]|nr:ATP-binding protein [Candidatus Cloacimonadota bacterium]